MQLIASGDAHLASIALGPPQAPAVLMVHGLLFGNMASWYAPLAAPLSATRRVLLYDQRGHGESAATPGGYDLDTQARDLAAVLDHHDRAQQPADLVGHSMGAVVALHFALRHPQRVRHLVLIDPPLPMARHVVPDLRGVGSSQQLADYVEAHDGPITPRRRERLHRRLSALFFESSLVADLAAAPEPDEGLLAAFDGPVLLIGALRSPCRESAEYLHSRLPRAELRWIDCGHYVIEEAPEVLRRELSRFLGETA